MPIIRAEKCFIFVKEVCLCLGKHQKKRGGGGALILTALAFLTFPTCEIGLGAAIDTERPVMQITYPPKGAIIMDSFILAGTVSDDMGLSYMNVTLTHKTLKTQFSYSSKNGEVIVEQPAKSWAAGTTWFARIGRKQEGKTLYNGWDIPDGEYFVDVEVSDGIGSVYDRRSITIDNTPPVFIVENENPEGHINDKYYLFGQKINLSGKAKDESDLSKVFFEVYDTDKTQILSSTLDYEMTYDGVLLASYSETAPADPKKKILADNFNTIYGTTYGAGSLKEIKERYMTVRVSDNARLYNEPVYKTLTEEEEANLGKGDGNFSTEIFLDPQGKTTLSLEGITIDEICEYKTHLTEDKTFEEKLNAMESTSIASVDANDFSKLMKIQINPDIFPKWFISNYEKKEGKDYNSAFLGSPLTLQFEKGNNDESFRPSNIRIVLARLKKIEADDGTITFEVIADAEKLETATESDADVIVLPKPKSEDLTKSHAEQIEVTKVVDGNELLVPATNYKICVYGHDGSGDSGYKFQPKEEGGYGFQVVKNLQPPKIYFLCNDDTYKEENLPKEDSWIGPNTSEIPFWFKVTTEGEELFDNPNVVVTLEKGTIKTNVITDGYYTLNKGDEPYYEKGDDGGKPVYTFKWSLKRTGKALPVDDNFDAEFNLRISITATDKAGTKITQPFTLQFDNKKPTLEVGTPSVVVEKDNKECLNGIVTIPVSFSDNYISNKADYKLTGKDNENNVKEESDKVANDGLITLDTTKFKDEANVTINVEIEDNYGNKKSYEKTYYIDQSTDLPSLTFEESQIDERLTDFAKIENSEKNKDSKNMLGIDTDNVISGTVADDDAVDTVTITAYKEDGTTLVEGSKTYTKKGSTTFSCNIKKDLGITAEGNYVIKVSVTDDKEVTGLAAANTTEKTVYIVVDDVAPEISNIKIDGTDYDNKQAFIKAKTAITFDVTEMHLETVSWSVGEDEKKKTTLLTNPTPVIKDGKKVYSYSFDYDPSEAGAGVVTLSAKDKTGLDTDKKLNITYDKVAPVINAPTVKPVCEYDGKTNVVNGTINISGIITDNDKVLDDDITIKFQKYDGNDKWSDISLTPTTKANQRYEFAEFDTTRLKDNEKDFKGEIRLVVEATDRSGNKSESSFTYYVDQDSDIPVITFTSVKADATEAKENLFGMGAWTIIGSVKDDDGLKNKDGTKVLKLYATEKDGTAVEAAQTGNFTIDNSGGFKYVVPAKDDNSIKGDQEVTFKVVDLYGEDGGRKNGTKTVTIKYAIDREKPQFESQTLNGETYSEDMFVKGAVDIVFTVSDDNAVMKIENHDGTKYVTLSEATTDTTTGKTTYITEYTHNISAEADGKKTKKYRLTDKYGRDNEIELNYEIDTTPPTVTAANFTVDGVAFGSLLNKWFNTAALKVSASADAVKDTNLSTTVSYTLSGDSGTFQMPLNAGKNASTSFSNTRSFNEGSSTLKYTFKDEAGNEKDVNISVQVDTTAPTVSGLSLSGLTDGLTNADSITVNFTASDKNGALRTSGLATAELGKKANFDDSDRYGDEISLSEDSATKAQEINIKELSDGQHEVWIRVKDNAGNVMADAKVGEFTIDRTAPAVTINPVDDADTTAEGTQVNKTITISGTASDTHVSKNVPVLSIYEADANGNKTGNAKSEDELITQNSSSFGSWSYSVDTTKLTDNKSYVFEVVATDKIGNTGSSSITLDVNQDTDRPIVTLDDIEIDGNTTLSKDNIGWKVSDDDGTPTTVEIQVTSSDETAAVDGDWITITADRNGKYLYTVPNPEGTEIPDGNYKLWFKITDVKSTVFTSSTATGANADLKKPKVLKDVSDTPTGDAVEFAVDTEPPVIDKIEIFFKQNANDEYETRQEGKNYELTNGSYYGGTLKRYGKIVITAHDAVVTNPTKLTYKLNGEPINKEYEINFGTISSGLNPMTFEVYDYAGTPGTKTRLVFVDNSEPNADGKAVTNMIPSSSTEVTGTVSVTANISDDSTVRSGIDTATVAYYIPKNNGTTVNEKDPSSIDESEWIYAKDDETFSVTDVLMAFEIAGLSTANATIAGDYSGHEQTSANSEVYNIPIWIKLSDKVGNTSYVTNNTIRYNPNAARPRISVTYPAHDKTGYGKDYVVLGGNIRISGSAQDNVGVKEVYVQYDINGDGKYDKTDYEWFSGKAGYELVKPIPTRTDETLEAGTSSDCWGVKAKGTASWSATFDATAVTKNLELGNKENPENKTLNVRVCAVDTDNDVDAKVPQHVSAWSEEIHISLNNSMPSYGKFYVVEYDSDAYSTEIGRTDYKEDMYICTTGKHWRLEGYVGDNDGISEISVTGTLSGNLNTAGWFTAFTKESNSEINLNGYYIHIPIQTDTSKFNLNIEPTDTGTPALTNPSSYSIKIDNKAPEFKDGTDEDTLALFQGDYSSKSKIDNTTKLQNSNGYTTIASKANDRDSGFAKAIFYAKRTKSDGTNPRVYNIMEAHGNDRTANRTDLAAADAVYINSDELPVLKKTNVTRPSEDKIGITGIGNNKNIRAGGAVLIGGFYRTIASVAADVVTLTEEVDTKYTDAYFVYGMVVNNSGESRDRSGNLKGDDGDGMIESITKSGSDYIWDATFDSTNIPDGPIEIHAVVFDNAGNLRHGFVTTRISNNSPRLARVTLGTDLNGDDNIGEDECIKFSASKDAKYESYSTEKLAYGIKGSERDNFKQVWDLDSATVKQGNGGDYWKIKSKLKIAPEFVGGTAPFYYVFSKEAGTGEDKRLKEEEKESGTDLSHATGNTGAQGKFELGGDIVLENTTIADTGENQENTYRFSFWDSTEESTVGVDTDWTILNVELYQDIEDSERPKPIIHPFFWKGSGSGKAANPNNSIQWETAEDGTETALGHIELEGDLTDDIKNTTVSATTLGGEPKVSGKIVLRGTAYDETRLTEINIKASDTLLLGSDGLTAKYTAASKEWSTGTATEAKLTVTDKGYSQKGHLVEWTLEVDTENLTNKVGNDITFTVQAKDGVAYSESTGSQTEFSTSVYATETQALLKQFYTDEAATTLAEDSINYGQSPLQFNLVSADKEIYEYKYGTTNTYKVDIVPYVTKVETKLTAKDGNTPGKYSRTSLGHYAVQSVVDKAKATQMSNKDSETITLSGFNLGGTVTVDGTSVTPSDGKISYSAANLKSRALKVTVGGIELMNNINNNNAKGVATTEGTNYANCYNRMANGDNNNELTDDIWFDVWEFNDRVAKAAAGGYMYGLNMKIGKGQSLIQYAYVSSNKEIYFAQKNGGTNYSSIYTSHTNRTQQDYLLPSSVGFGVKDDGKTYATVLGGEDTDDYELLVCDPKDNGSVSHYSIDIVYGVNNALKDQIYSPSFAFGKNDYLAYYDKYNKQIRFLAAGQLTTSKLGNSGNGAVARIPEDSGENTDDANCQVIAGDKGTGNAAHGAGAYVSLAAIAGGTNTNDVVCIVWYDLAANTLWYSYKTDPTANTTGTTGEGWRAAKAIFTGGGEYCQIAIDGNNGIHIAAYVGGEVQYAYAPSYSSDFKTCVVDVNDVGKNLTLDVALVEEKVNDNTTIKKPIPVIGYYSGAQMPKYAKLVDTSWIGAGKTNQPPEGADENKRYTGKWDVTFVPVRNNLILDRVEKVNVGVWKTSAGVLTNSTATASTYVNTAINDASKNNSKAYGNGTNNGVLLYLTDSGENMESAQLRASE